MVSHLLPIVILISINFLSFFQIPTLTLSSPPYKALVSPITKDTNTSLYTIPIVGKPLVLDLTNPLIWSICPSNHPTIPCESSICSAAHQFPPPGNCTYGKQNNKNGNKSCNCTSNPYNPISGKCGSGDLTLTTLTTNGTDGKNPLYLLNATNAVASCAPSNLLESLPSNAAGIAGLASSNLTLPSQLSSMLNIEKQFALCLPGGGTGVAFFGSGPFYLLPPTLPNITSMLSYTPLIKNPQNPFYYINVTGIAVNLGAVQLPQNALAGGVLLSTVSTYTILREDIYKPFFSAYDDATKSYPRISPVKPFDLCFDSSKLPSTRMGYGVPQIDLMLDGGKNWTVFGANSMAPAGPNTVCLGFLANQTATPAAIMIGGFQMENNFLLFDFNNSRLGSSGLLFGIKTTCANFNFTYSI